MTHARLYVVKKIVASIMAFILAPALVVWVYWLDTQWAVVTDFRILTETKVDGGAIVTGTMDKRRDCQFIEVLAMTDGEPADVVFLDLSYRPEYSRARGPQRWGPWLVRAEDGQGVVLYARHQCHAAWDHTDRLTSFVVGAHVGEGGL